METKGSILCLISKNDEDILSVGHHRHHNRYLFPHTRSGIRENNIRIFKIAIHNNYTNTNQRKLRNQQELILPIFIFGNKYEEQEACFVRLRFFAIWGLPNFLFLRSGPLDEKGMRFMIPGSISVSELVKGGLVFEGLDSANFDSLYSAQRFILQVIADDQVVILERARRLRPTDGVATVDFAEDDAGIVKCLMKRGSRMIRVRMNAYHQLGRIAMILLFEENVTLGREEHYLSSDFLSSSFDRRLLSLFSTKNETGNLHRRKK